MKREISNKIYGIGVLLTLIGGIGLGNVITESKGSFPISLAIFGIGFAMVLIGYIRE